SLPRRANETSRPLTRPSACRPCAARRPAATRTRSGHSRCGARARRLVCDASVVGIVEGEEGEPLDIARKTRSIPLAISRALKARDGGCRFPGCDRTRFCDGHHIKHWADGGETKLDNLITLCGFHHRLVHEGGYGVKRTDDGVFVFSRPDGTRVEQNGVNCFRGNILPPVQSSYARFEDCLRGYMKTRDPDLSITAET